MKDEMTLEILIENLTDEEAIQMQDIIQEMAAKYGVELTKNEIIQMKEAEV